MKKIGVILYFFVLGFLLGGTFEALSEMKERQYIKAKCLEYVNKAGKQKDTGLNNEAEVNAFCRNRAKLALVEKLRIKLGLEKEDLKNLIK